MDKDREKESLEDDVVFEQEEDSSVEKKLRRKLKKAVEEKQEYLEGWQRAKADFVNYKKEEEKRNTSSLYFVKEKLVLDLLPILDSFTEAEKSLDWNKGLESIKGQLENYLKGYGVEEIIELKKFDPKLHESVQMIPTEEEKEDGLIIEVMQKGYKVGDKIIRPVKVKVKIYQSK